MIHSVKPILAGAAWLALAGMPLIAHAQAQAPVTDPGMSDKLQADLCASKSGDAREACLREGQDRKITADVRGDARAESTDSDYNVARAKCDALAATERDSCIRRAKKKYKP